MIVNKNITLVRIFTRFLLNLKSLILSAVLNLLVCIEFKKSEVPSSVLVFLDVDGSFVSKKRFMTTVQVDL